jgi:hypothetical protein
MPLAVVWTKQACPFLILSMTKLECEQDTEQTLNNFFRIVFSVTRVSTRINELKSLPAANTGELWYNRT